MSIKLDWDVSEAPQDDELAPSTTYHKPKTSERPAPAADSKRLAARGHRRRWLAAGALVLAAAGGGLWAYAQTGWQRVSDAVSATVVYEDQQAAQGATNLLLNVQDRGNVDWTALRRAEAQAHQPAPLPLPRLSFSPTPASVTRLSVLDTQFMQATVSRQFNTPDGQVLTFNLPQFYRRDDSGAWLRSAPPGAFWGNWLDWHGAHLDIRYSERDADFVQSAAPELDQRLADACAAWGQTCQSSQLVRLYLSGFVGALEYDPLSNVEVRVETSTPDGQLSGPSDYYLSVPSPQLAGIPADAVGRGRLTDYLAVRLIASLAQHVSNSPQGYHERTVQAIVALGLLSADPGYVTAGKGARGSASDAAPPPTQPATAR